MRLNFQKVSHQTQHQTIARAYAAESLKSVAPNATPSKCPHLMRLNLKKGGGRGALGRFSLPFCPFGAKRRRLAFEHAPEPPGSETVSIAKHRVARLSRRLYLNGCPGPACPPKVKEGQT
jgi:hypothetical protein